MRVPRIDDGVRTVGVVSGGHFLSHFYLLVLPPIFPLLRTEFGLSNARLGLLISVISLAMALQLPVGEVVDRIGSKRVFVIGLAVTSLGIVFSGLATSYGWLLAFTVLSGLGQSTFHPAGYPLIEFSSNPGREGRNFSIHTFGGYVGSALAPVLVGTLAILMGWHVALVAVGAVGVAYAGVAWVAIDEPDRGGADGDSTDEDGSGHVPSIQALIRPGILVMFTFFFVVTMANKGIQSFTPLLAIDGFGLTEGVGNAALSGFFAATAVGVLLGGIAADRLDPRRVIAASLGIAAVLTWLLVSGTFSMSPTTMVVLTGTMGVFYGIIYPSRDKLVSMLSAEGSTGRSFGFVFTGTSIGGFVAPVVLGLVIDLTAIRIAFLLIGASFLLAGLVALVVGSRFVGQQEWARVSAE